MPLFDPLADHDPILMLIATMLDIKIAHAVDPRATVLLRGERGVGKDLAARMIHAASPRRSHPFIKVNCAIRFQDRLEAELLGHEKGASALADRRRLGSFEFANTGTIFLDEIGELPRVLGLKLLGVLRHRKVSRDGGQTPFPVDVQVIASTRLDAVDLSGEDEFWESFYDLNVVEIRIPPLRERREAIPALASLFLSRFNQQHHRSAELSPRTVRLLVEYTWPGNMRELEEVVRRLVMTGDPCHIHQEIRTPLTLGRSPEAAA